MSPNADAARNSPISVVDLSQFIMVGGREYDLEVTESMFRHHFRSAIAEDGFMCQWYEDILLRLDRMRMGLTVVWIPDCNTGEFLDVVEWFVRYGFAPDMVIQDHGPELAALLEADAEEMTASITLGSSDTSLDLSFSSLSNSELIDLTVEED